MTLLVKWYYLRLCIAFDERVRVEGKHFLEQDEISKLSKWYLQLLVREVHKMEKALGLDV